MSMKKFIMSCATFLLTAVCMANSLSCSGSGNSQLPRESAGYTIDESGFTTLPVIPISKDAKTEWKYVTSQPASDWKNVSFDDSAWKSGNNAFGTSSTNGTSWTTTDIWMRKEFTLAGCTAQVIDSLLLSVAHDEDCEIYINGVVAAEFDGWEDYKNVAISDNAKAAIKVGEKNILAVHCYNGGAPGVIDVGLYKHALATSVTFFNVAKVAPTTWKYVTETPADSLTWMNPEFNDSVWSEGQAGFGYKRTTQVINTQWTTSDLWLRKKVSFKGFSKKDLQSLKLTVVRDGVCEIYFNGVLAAALEKNGIKTEEVAISEEALNAISPEGETTIAVHIYRTNSQKYFDASLSCKAEGLLAPVKWEMKKAPLMSIFAKDVDPNNAWAEYPRPQMERKEWQSLNGLWGFQPLFTDKAGLPEDVYGLEILVPYPVESALSGIMEDYRRFAYKRTFTVPSNWKERRLLLHFEAVDCECEVFVNGQSVGTHAGGYEPFSFDVTNYLTAEGEQELVVKVYDPTDYGNYARGKQTLFPGGIMYTSTSGIWQSVWMEPVEDVYIENYTVVPDVDNSSVTVKVNVKGNQAAKAVIAVKDGDKVVSKAETVVSEKATISVPDAKLWSPDSPFLYDLDITLVDGEENVDAVKGYFGMRKISLGKVGDYTKMFLNNEPLFHMGPLDQGFWPDGLYTAPTDAAMLYDIEMTKQMGFNMIRKHIKIEPRRWYYHCDRLGLLVWQDMPSPNSYSSITPPALDKTKFKKELRAMIDNLYNSPCIIMWVLFNESQARHDVESLVKYIKMVDPSRLANQDSQYGVHSTYVGDVWDIHHYPNPAYVSCANKNLANVCGEYGGLKFKVDGHTWGAGDWGYATMNSRQELMDTYEAYVFDLIKFSSAFGMGGAVYTQTTDVEIEINGLITYDRAVVKVDVPKLAEINKRLTNIVYQKDTIIPTAVDGGTMWKMTTTQPSTDWFKPEFDDSSWKEKKSGFGTSNTPNAVVGTTWSSSDIWIRKNFRLDGMNRQMADSLVMLMTHDEDCEIYINGKLLASYEGHDNNYSQVEFTTAVKNALLYDAENTIAVHCHQTHGGQFIDLGIYLVSSQGLTTSIGDVAADNTPRVDIDDKNKTVAIVGGGFGDGTRLEVVSAAGAVVKNVIAGNDEVSLSTIPAGVYVLRYADGNRKHTCKVVI